MKPTKKFISFALVFIMCLSLLPMTAIAGEDGNQTFVSYSNALDPDEWIAYFPEYAPETGESATIVIERPDGTLYTAKSPSLGVNPFGEFSFPNDELVNQTGKYTVKEVPVPKGYRIERIECYASETGDNGFTITEADMLEPPLVTIRVLLMTTDLVDVPSEWATAQVNTAITANLVPSSLQSKYTQATTRAEFCALIVALYENVKGEITERKKFNDTNDINVEKAAAIGVVSGSNTEGTLFSPDTQLTREQAAVMLTRLADAVGSPLTGHGQGTDFSDKSNISDWAVGAVNQVSASEIMGSTSTAGNVFSPKSPYTREQSITTIMRLYEIVK